MRYNENNKSVADVTTYYDPAEEIAKEEERLKKDHLTLLSKIEQAKNQFAQYDVKKTGQNKFQHYKYYELKDIMPAIRDIKYTLNLSTRFEFTDEVGILRVTDLDTGVYEYYHCPLPHIYGDDIRREMQDVGACQTYARRYLLLMFLEITEPDAIDKGKPGNTKKIKHTKNKNSKQERREETNSEDHATKTQDQTSRRLSRNTPYDGVRGTITDNEGFTLGEKLCHEIGEDDGIISTSTLKRYTLRQLQQQHLTKNEYDMVIGVLDQLPVLEE